MKIGIYYRGSPPLYFYFYEKHDIVDHGIAKCIFCVSNTNYVKSKCNLQRNRLLRKYLMRICLIIFSSRKMCTC